MSSAKSKGTRFETATVNYINGVLGLKSLADPHTARRAVQYGRKDVGDVHAHPFVIQNKDCKSLSVPKWLRDASEQSSNAGFPFSVVAVKTRGKGIALARVHISDETFGRLITDYDISGVPVPCPNRRGYHTWTLAEFCEVLETVRSQGVPGEG